MRVAFLGCGYVADVYAQTLRRHRHIELAGVMDLDAARTASFAAAYRARPYWSFESLLDDRSIPLIVNLTNPDAHYATTRACLEAGKHVYSEKPLAAEFTQARELVELAERRGLLLSGAPCNLLGDTAQTFWKALRENVIGPVRLAYAELEDGPLYLMPYRRWNSSTGTPWPWKDELEVGCTIEHAGYYLAWLAAMFGPAERVVAFSHVTVPDKQTDAPLDVAAPDFSVACIVYKSGVTVRLTCGIVAPHDHTLRVIGDEGVLSTPDAWITRGPVVLRRWLTVRRRHLLSPRKRRIPLLRGPGEKLPKRGALQLDFAAGIADLAHAIETGRPPHLTPRLCLHVCELTLAIHSARTSGGAYEMTTTFDPIEPMDWAKGGAA